MSTEADRLYARIMANARYARDPERFRAKQRSWYAANKAKSATYCRAYQQANREKINARKRELYRQRKTASD